MCNAAFKVVGEFLPPKVPLSFPGERAKLSTPVPFSKLWHELQLMVLSFDKRVSKYNFLPSLIFSAVSGLFSLSTCSGKTPNSPFACYCKGVNAADSSIIFLIGCSFSVVLLQANKPKVANGIA